MKQPDKHWSFTSTISDIDIPRIFRELQEAGVTAAIVEWKDTSGQPRFLALLLHGSLDYALVGVNSDYWWTHSIPCLSLSGVVDKYVHDEEGKWACSHYSKARREVEKLPQPRAAWRNTRVTVRSV